MSIDGITFRNHIPLCFSAHVNLFVQLICIPGMTLCLTIISKNPNSSLCCTDMDMTVTGDLDHHTPQKLWHDVLVHFILKSYAAWLCILPSEYSI